MIGYRKSISNAKRIILYQYFEEDKQLDEVVVVVLSVQTLTESISFLHFNVGTEKLKACCCSIHVTNALFFYRILTSNFRIMQKDATNGKCSPPDP